MSEQVRMTAEEYRKLMGLDDKSVGKVTGTIRHVRNKEQPPLGDAFQRSLTNGLLRVFWLVSWAYLILTFGWVPHVYIRLVDRRLNGTKVS